MNQRKTKALDAMRAGIHLDRDNCHVPYSGWGDNVPRHVVKEPMTAKNRIMIFGPKSDGTYVVEFRTAKSQVLAISVPRGETAVLQHFQERMPYGLFVPDVQSRLPPDDG
jgi:hypothetical protein